jgi:hypothetical protein
LYAYHRYSGGMGCHNRRRSCYFPAFDRRTGARKRGCRPRRPNSRHSRSGVPGRDGSGRPDVLQGYGVAPDFRAGLHLGPLVAGEIGGFKRHLGDTMNTATRIAQAWRHTGCPLLISKPLLDRARRCRQQHWRPTPGWQRGTPGAVRGRAPRGGSRGVSGPLAAGCPKPGLHECG